MTSDDAWGCTYGVFGFLAGNIRVCFRHNIIAQFCDTMRLVRSASGMPASFVAGMQLPSWPEELRRSAANNEPRAL